ncbi:hypothetical protein QZH41_006429 [Actinostola sp. cb2023]|nr:hypothetical protein QZH41_006429 [Actinostola sp. cb2023]
MASSLVESTLEACSLLNLNSIPSEWTRQVWNDDFYESHGLPEVLEANAAEKQFYKEELHMLLLCCRRWTTSTQDSSAEGFWKVLSDNEIPLRSLIAVLHAMIESSKRQSRPGPKLESCVLSANIYMVLLQIPGSGAYNVYHHLLLQKAIDVLKHWPSKDDDDDSRDDDDDNSNDDDFDTVVSLEAVVTAVKNRLVELLQDMVLLLSIFSLKGSEQTCVHIMQRLTDMVKMNSCSTMPTSFAIPERSVLQKIKSVVQLGYTVFKNLVPLFLMADGGSTLHKDVQVTKDYAIAFAW